ncbi:MAG: hypothetical protein IPK17_29420 [Chloroflexi bacterium]|uniref:hypothetical protein n=1 Tax=Candidatus Flexifilum breve TaxID=3140694 RepID=UPI003136656E|nr:hypothetical protein [Chloroflexota bacterium]
MHARFRDAFGRFQAVGITYCVLRDGDQLERFADGGEIDLLVQADQVTVLERELVQLGYMPLQRWGDYPHHQFILDDAGSNSVLKLDVVTAVWFGASVKYLRTDLAAQWLKRRRALGDIYVLAPEDEVILLLLHCVIDKREFRPLRQQRLQSLRASVTDPQSVTNLLRTYWQAGASWEQIAAHIDRGDWAGLLKQRPAVIAHLRRGDTLTSMMRHVRQRVLRKVGRWASKLRFQLLLPLLSAEKQAHARREFGMRWNSRVPTALGNDRGTL